MEITPENLLDYICSLLTTDLINNPEDNIDNILDQSAQKVGDGFVTVVTYTVYYELIVRNFTITEAHLEVIYEYFRKMLRVTSNISDALEETCRKFWDFPFKEVRFQGFGLALLEDGISEASYSTLLGDENDTN